MTFFRTFLSSRWINLLIFASLIFCEGRSNVYAIAEIAPPPVEESPRYEPPPMHREQQPRTPATDVRWVIPAQFDAAKSFSQGLAAVKIEEKWGFIDKQGNVVISVEYDEVGDFSEGMAKVGKKIGKEMRYGFIDNTGRIAIPLQFYAADTFSDGLASIIAIDSTGSPVKKPTYIDKTGRIVLQLKFKGAGDNFFEGLALVDNSEDYYNNGIIDKSGKVLYWFGHPGEGHVIRAEGMMTWRNADGYVNAKTGRLAIPIGVEIGPFDQYYFCGGLAPVKRNEKWGYVDKAGRTVIPFQFDYAEPFSDDGLAYVLLNKESGFIDKTGQMVVKPKIDLHWYGGTSPNVYRFEFVEGLVRVSSYEKTGYYFGYFDKTGELVIPVQFGAAEHFSEGLAAVAKGGKYGYIGKP